MGDTIIENSRSEKYLEDQIYALIIHETHNGRISLAMERGDDILYIYNQHSLIGFNIASGPVEQYESKIS